jgi:hypothetical protein
MAGTFSVEWLPGNVLLQRRSGMLTADEANDYVAAVKAAIAKAPARWGAVVDARNAVAQSDEVQAIIQGLIKYVVGKGVKRVVIVSTSTITALQEKRITTAPGMHDPSTVAFYSDYEAALADVRSVV